MAHITEEHLHHMARRHHATMQKFDGLREKMSGYRQRFVGTAEIGAGSWLGGMIEGRTSGSSIGPFPINLVAGVLLLAAGHLELAGAQWSNHLNNVGNGFVGSYAAATGYAFGKRWKETKSVFGGGGHPWRQPYESGWTPEHAPAAPAVHGDLSQEQMDGIVQRMREAAVASVHP